MFTSILCAAQKHDTLENIKVISKKIISTTSAVSPVQILNTIDPSKTNSITVADAVKHFAGVTVKDYGGIGGLKTISVRSLGANHTGVLYDGIVLGDAQGGQIDLGKFSLDNINQIELYSIGPLEILSTAKAFSYASILSLKTNANILLLETDKKLDIRFQKGSFGYFSPTISYKNIYLKKIATALSASYQSAKSDYPFTSYENNNTVEKRINSAIKTVRVEYDAAYHINDSNKISLKTYYYNSKRGLPGAIVFYNTSSSQKLNDENFFVQSNWQKKISLKSTLLISAKYASDNNYYLDPSYPNSFGKLENNFHSKEVYFSTAYSHNINKAIKISAASDVLQNKLTRTDIFAKDFANPTRNTFLNNVAFQIKKQPFDITGNILYTVINEKVLAGNTARNLHKFSNAISASVQLAKNIPLILRASYKHIFRAPTFNDLYYTNIGNTLLKPEYADQINAGITFYKPQFLLFKNISITADAYLNKVTDKIIALPRQNLFQWSVQNIGKVNVKGIDIALHTNITSYKKIDISANFAYSFQEVLDVTDEASSLYKTQLPYTPKHSGSSTISVQYKKALFNYNIIFSSYRYKQGDAIFENLLQPWSSNDVSFSYLLGNKTEADYKIIIEALNIFNTQYEIIKYFPMPRFNYRITFNASFKKQKK